MFKKGDRIHLHDGTVHTMRGDGLPPRAGKRSRRKDFNDEVSVRGFVRGALVDCLTGEEQVGEWHENIITEQGHAQIIKNFAGLAGSVGAQWWAIGSHQSTGATSNYSTTLGLTSEYGTNSTQSANSAAAPRANVSAGQALAGIWTLSQSFAYSSTQISNNVVINAIGQASSSAYSSSALLSLATFGSSSKSNNQALNITYNWSFGT